METFATLPRRITGRFFACHPCTSRSIEKILCSQNIRRQEQLRIFDRTVDMALGSKIHNIVDVVCSKQFVGKFPVPDVTMNKETAFIINIILDSSEITSISQSIEDDDFNVFILILFINQILYKI